jgi:hypothetical protein
LLPRLNSFFELRHPQVSKSYPIKRQTLISQCSGAAVLGPQTAYPHFQLVWRPAEPTISG